MKTASLLVALVVASFTVGWFVQKKAQRPNTNAMPAAAPAVPDPDVIAKLEERVRILERMAEANRVLMQAGREIDGDESVLAALAEARIRLARERNQPQEVLVALTNLMASQRDRLVRIEALALDRLPAFQVDKLKLELLDAEIRLLKEQKRR